MNSFGWGFLGRVQSEAEISVRNLKNQQRALVLKRVCALSTARNYVTFLVWKVWLLLFHTLQDTEQKSDPKKLSYIIMLNFIRKPLKNYWGCQKGLAETLKLSAYCPLFHPYSWPFLWRWISCTNKITFDCNSWISQSSEKKLDDYTEWVATDINIGEQTRKTSFN